MGHSAANDLRSLLSAAAGLRQMATSGRHDGDRTVYLMAAEAMERRAKWLAGQSPEIPPEHMADSTLHRPVNLIV